MNTFKRAKNNIMTIGKNWNGRRCGAYYTNAERRIMQYLVKNSLTIDEYKTYKNYLANVKNLLPGCVKGDAGAKIELQKLLHQEGMIEIIEKVRWTRQQGNKAEGKQGGILSSPKLGDDRSGSYQDLFNLK